MQPENQENDSGSLPGLITARNLCRSFTNGGVSIDILRDLNFDLAAGETAAIVGASGIGKSTLLHILGTLDRADSGQLLFKGEDVFAYDDMALARFRNKSVGFVFQFHHLLPEFNAVENTMMPALIGGASKRKAIQTAENLLVRVGLKDRLLYRVGKLSGGEQQRVALARALVLKPALLLADEPTGNLDESNSEHFPSLLIELHQEFSMALVGVTHNSKLAALMSRGVTIADGKLTGLP